MCLFDTVMLFWKSKEMKYQNLLFVDQCLPSLPLFLVELNYCYVDVLVEAIFDFINSRHFARNPNAHALCLANSVNFNLIVSQLSISWIMRIPELGRRIWILFLLHLILMWTCEMLIHRWMCAVHDFYFCFLAFFLAFFVGLLSRAQAESIIFFHNAAIS